MAAACAASLVIGAPVLGWGVQSAGATITTVNCSTTNLQTAINNAAGGSTLQVSGNCTNTSVSPSPNFTIDKNLRLQGPAILNGSDSGTVLTVTAGTVTLSDVTVEGGNTAGMGGGIFNQGALTLNSSTVVGNTAGDAGGGIFNDGRLTLNSSKVWANDAGNYGGGIWNSEELIGSATSFVILNLAGIHGGGIYNGREYLPNDMAVELNIPDNVYTHISPCVSGGSSGGPSCCVVSALSGVGPSC
jgi:hypothetical protein